MTSLFIFMLKTSLTRSIKSLLSVNLTDVVKINSGGSNKIIKRSSPCKKSINRKMGFLIPKARVAFT